jgi:hypothetical protein
MKLFNYLIFLVFILGCGYPEISKDIVVYSNDFNEKIVDKIDGAELNDFNGSKVLGFYNKDGFDLHLDNLEKHDYVFISFDLYIHGSWDGNVNGFDFEKDGIKDSADKWIMEINPDMGLYQNTDFQKFETTFSNNPCYSNWCRRQSFPNHYPFENIPYSGASKIGLERICEGYWGGPTTLYKIEKGFRHSGNALVVRFYDELFQPNAIDFQGNNSEKCDESWSIDNLRIRAITYE